MTDSESPVPGAGGETMERRITDARVRELESNSRLSSAAMRVYDPFEIAILAREVLAARLSRSTVEPEGRGVLAQRLGEWQYRLVKFQEWANTQRYGGGTRMDRDVAEINRLRAECLDAYRALEAAPWGGPVPSEPQPTTETGDT